MFSANSITADNTMFGCPSSRGELVMEKRWKSNHTESAPNCPRCASSNTKFCYYNNYSLSQPRYFCKGCRRYWTKGGSLRNVPVGGGCRKSRKSKSARLADQRSGLSYQMPSPGSTSDDHDQSNGSTIDLAAVFAKFLNQDSSSNEAGEDANVNVIDHQESSSSGVSYNSVELAPNSFDLENMILECQTTPYDHFMDDGAQIHEGIPPLLGVDHGENAVQDDIFLQNCDSLNFQAILGDEEETSNLPNFEWQSIMQFQDFGSSNDDDDDGMKIPSNLAAEESWSSFDLSGFEIFPRHWS